MKLPEGTDRTKLGLWMSVALVAGNMVGSGVFLLPASLALFGGISIIGWIFSSAGALILALLFSRLSRRIPLAGGPYIYTRKSLGNFPGFLVAWGYWIAIWSGNAAIAVAGAGYLGTFVPGISENPVLGGLVAISFIWLFTWINTLGIRQAGMVQLITTVLKLLPLILLGSVGFIYFESGYFHPLNLSNESSFSAITATAALTLWAFLGLESATIPSENVKDPKRTIPKATIMGTLVVCCIYIFSTVAVMGIVSPEKLSVSTAPFADAAEKVWGKWAGYAIAGGALVACLGALNGWVLLQGQLPLAVSRDGLFPPVFARLSSRKIPGPGLLISSLLASVLIVMNYTRGLVSMFTFIIMLATLSTIIPYAFSALADLVLYIKQQRMIIIGKLIEYSFIPVMAFLFLLWAIWGLGFGTIAWGTMLLIAGIPFFYLFRIKGKE